MNEKELLETLIGEGWRVSSDEVGDQYCRKEKNGMLVQLLPYIKRRSNHYRLGLMPSLSTRQFSEAVSYICDTEVDFEPIVSSNLPATKLSYVSQGSVLDLLDSAEKWAESQCIEDGLRRYCELQTDCKGAYPLRHLAALAVAGEVSRLEDYASSFLQGNRLGFVNYIKKEFIDRAAAFSKTTKQRG
ncbi:hypothetical protein SAMN05660691_00590 [Rheinheimera pacifica]|uniref:Uncharacterized protein n=1 Tax=Rheinheimera pacifica TaxID=173990 RepID=A0A1H6JTX5_9GAMM|nr:hypothetical protein [Rheinheimera pacifica]SEH64430.1 hypothetical protein SAMN05660691_00590 [Rheinheimera pacifica]